MNRMFALIFASLVLAAAMSGKGVARVMGAGDVAVAQVATPAVVNIALWKLRPPTKAAIHHVE